MRDLDRQEGAQGLRRLRWRLRGAWLWPTFVVATLLEMVLLHVLPVQGDSTGWVGALLAAGCLNLLAVVVVGGVGGPVLRRRRPDLPKVVADDYAGTVALGLMAAAFVVAGLVHAPRIADREEAFAQQSRAVRAWIAANGNAFARAHISRANSILLDDDLYRTCVPARDPKRPLCLIVDTSASPPKVRRDRSREPNSGFVPRYR